MEKKRNPTLTDLDFQIQEKQDVNLFEFMP